MEPHILELGVHGVTEIRPHHDAPVFQHDLREPPHATANVQNQFARQTFEREVQAFAGISLLIP